MILIMFVGLLLGAFAYSLRSEPQLTKREDTRPEAAKGLEGSLPSLKVTNFPHDKHRQACSSCHKFPSNNWKRVRKPGEAFPDITEYPRHESCLKCHRRQFFGSPKPSICSVCHINASPRRSARHPFPNPREIFDKSPKGKISVSDFAISFPHSTHIDIVSDIGSFGQIDNVKFQNARMTRRAVEESCSVCHKTASPQGDSDEEFLTPPPKDLGDSFWLKKGTFKTSPIGHTTCFMCHSAETGILPAPNNCAACHSLKQKSPAPDFDSRLARKMKIGDKVTVATWQKRDSSGTFRHEFSMHNDLECATCHSVNSIKTLEPATKKVNVLSCSPCHITATADDGGVLNFEVDSRNKNTKFECTKCHISFGKRDIPESHLKAIDAQQ